MKVVGVRELKARLSEYLRIVKAGGTILVTERDEVVAELSPCRRQRRSASSVEEILDALADQGVVTRASTPKKGWKWKPTALGLPSGTAKTIVDESRQDRV